MGTKAQRLNELTTKQVSNLDPTNCIAIWPVSSLEQHGPHLPLGTDAIILENIVEKIREKLEENFNGFFLPQMNYGKSPEHLMYPGTISIQATTLLAVADDVVASLSKHGFKRFVFLNSHGGNTALLEAASFDLRYKYDAKILNLYLFDGNDFNSFLSQLFPNLKEIEIHAASLETSVMLYLRPELVGKIPQGNPAEQLLSLGPWGWATSDFGANGVIGDPSYASAEIGEVLVNYAVNRVCEILYKLEDQFLDKKEVGK